MDELVITKSVNPSSLSHAVRSGAVLCLYEKRSARRWSAVLDVASIEQEQVLIDLLNRHGVELTRAEAP